MKTIVGIIDDFLRLAALNSPHTGRAYKAALPDGPPPADQHRLHWKRLNRSAELTTKPEYPPAHAWFGSAGQSPDPLL